MKKNSDYFSWQTITHKVGSRLAIVVALVMLVTINVQAQDFSFIEGSVHSFSVENHEGNLFQWQLHDQSFNSVGNTYISYLEGQDSCAVTVQFGDLSRTADELVYLAVTETRNEGCSTTRAVLIELMPNNMYFDFAVYAPDESTDCYSYETAYTASVEVGMNFTDRAGSSDSAIPAERFPLKVKYTVEDKTNNPGTIIEGNEGNYIVIDYNADNEYSLEISEAVGLENLTTEYELTITEVVDNYGTSITHDENRKIQIRVINHLPQTGGMDMALAYTLSPVNYLGSN